MIARSQPIRTASCANRMAAVPASARTDVQLRAWRVLHACDRIADVHLLVEGQLAAGMRPAVVTPDGVLAPENCIARYHPEQERRLSLLTAWNDVRQWRKSMIEADPTCSSDIVHAHGFASGMAAVRSCPAVVYDLDGFVEDLAASGGSEPGAWLARSFRVAEQFVVTRAGAVVVHVSSMRQGVLERGADEANVFCIPRPVPEEWLESDAPMVTREVAFFAPGLRAPKPGEKVSALLLMLLEAMTAVAGEVDDVVLLLEGSEAHVTGVQRELEFRGSPLTVRSIESAERDGVEPGVLIALPAAGQDKLHIGAADLGRYGTVEAMARGRVILAADVPQNRDESPEGRGWLWFSHEDGRDLAARASFLARNPDFRRMLGESARRFVRETRSPHAVAESYDAAYRHAISRRRRPGTPLGTAVLQPMLSCI